MRLKCPSGAPQRRRKSFIALLLLLAPAALQAQQNAITFNDTQVTVGKVMSEIYTQAGITFAFDAGTFDTNRTVALRQRSYELKEALDLIIADTHFTYMQNEDYVVINSAPKARPVSKPAAPLLADNRDIERTPVPVVTAWRSRQVAEPRATPEKEPVIIKEYPAPYSEYRDPNLYTTMKGKLPLLAVKVNLLYAAGALTPNLSGEIGITPKTTLEFGGSWNRFNRIGTADNNRKLNHWIVRPEFRYWLCERYNGHFFGLHAFYSEYNISNHNIPLLFDKAYRYEGNAFGAGITYGYNLPLAKKWSLEFHIGVGAARLKYDKHNCTLCSDALESTTKTYFGPTRAGISLVFLIK